MMQRKQLVALVAGASVGVGAGVLGAFLAWAAVGEAARRLLEQFDDQDIELEHPVSPAERHSAQQTSPRNAPVPSPASDTSLPHHQEAVTSAQAP